jgi:hypothetical protein
MDLGFLLKGGCGVAGLGGINTSIYAAVLLIQNGPFPVNGVDLVQIVGWVNAILSVGLVLGALKLAFEYGKLTKQVELITQSIESIHEDIRDLRSNP